MRGNSPASPLGLPGHSPIWRERQRRLRNGVTDTVLRKRLRIRMNGNVTLETRHYSVSERITDGVANYFPVKNAPEWRILHIQSRNLSGSDIPEPSQKRPRCLDPDTNFRLARQRSHCSCFTKRPLSYIRISYAMRRKIRCSSMSSI